MYLDNMFFYLFIELRFFFVRGRKYGKKMDLGGLVVGVFMVLRMNSNIWGVGVFMIMFILLKCGVIGMSRVGGSRKSDVVRIYIILSCDSKGII